MNTKDLYMKYGVVFRKRKTRDQKLKFLASLQHEFESMGFEATVMFKQYKSKGSYSLYVNNLNKVKTIYATTYDNPIVSPITHQPFNITSNRKRMIVGTLIPFIIMSVIALLISRIFYTTYWKVDPWSTPSMIGFAVLVAILIFMGIFNQGISRRNVFKNNTSSIIELIKFAKNNPKYGYVFTDYGNQDLFGYLCLRDYLKGQDKNMYFIDSIGNNPDNVIRFDSRDIKDSVLNDWFDAPNYITSGKLVEGVVYQSTEEDAYDNDAVLISK